MLFSLSGQVRSGLLHFCRTFTPDTSFRAAGNSGSARWNRRSARNSSRLRCLCFQEERQLGNQEHIPADYLNGNLRVKGPLSLLHAAVRARLLAAKGMVYLWLLILTLACPCCRPGSSPQ